MEVWREPVRGVYGDLAVLAMPGIDRFRRGFAGELAPPPIHHLTGMHPTEASQGRCVFAMPATDWLRTSLGTIPLGALAFLADAALGGVVNTGLGPGSVASTSELSLRAVRPATTSAGSFVAEAELTHLGRLLALGQGRVTDSHGRLLATTSTRCFVTTFPLPDDIPPPTPPPAYDTPSPWELPSTGRLFTAAQLESLTGLDILRGSLHGEQRSMPAPPIHYLFGLRPVAADEGSSRWVMPATPWLSAGAPFMYGGAIALLADTALAGTAWTVSPGGTLPYTMDLNVRFLRPGPLEGELVAEGTVVHRGRTMVVSQARVTTADGALVALADGSAALVPLDVRALPLEDAMADRLDPDGGPRRSPAPA